METVRFHALMELLSLKGLEAAMLTRTNSASVFTLLDYIYKQSKNTNQILNFIIILFTFSNHPLMSEPYFFVLNDKFNSYERLLQNKTLSYFCIKDVPFIIVYISEKEIYLIDTHFSIVEISSRAVALRFCFNIFNTFFGDNDSFVYIYKIYALPSIATLNKIYEISLPLFLQDAHYQFRKKNWLHFKYPKLKIQNQNDLKQRYIIHWNHLNMVYDYMNVIYMQIASFNLIN